MSPWKRLCVCAAFAGLFCAGNVATPAETEDLAVAPATLAPVDPTVIGDEPRLVLQEATGQLVPHQAMLRLDNPTHLPLRVVARSGEAPLVLNQREDAPLPDWSALGWSDKGVIVSLPPGTAWLFEAEHCRDPVAAHYMVRIADAAGAPGQWLVSPLYRHPRVGPAAPGRYPGVLFVEWKQARGQWWGIFRLNNPTRQPLRYLAQVSVDPWPVQTCATTIGYGWRPGVPCGLMVHETVLPARTCLLFPVLIWASDRRPFRVGVWIEGSRMLWSKPVESQPVSTSPAPSTAPSNAAGADATSRRLPRK